MFLFHFRMQSLFSLQHVRGNFTRLHSALDELKLFVRESQNIPKTPGKFLFNITFI